MLKVRQSPPKNSVAEDHKCEDVDINVKGERMQHSSHVCAAHMMKIIGCISPVQLIWCYRFGEKYWVH